MLVTLVIILLLIWAAVVWSIYSNFLVFYSNFSESENYHRAYYTSISALERWELVVKQRSPWYVWSGGFRMWTRMGSYNNWWDDSSLTWFSYLWDNPEISTVFWTVESKTTRIPATWEWNIEWMLSAQDSDNYNMMDYENAENFLLYIDRSEGSPYKKVECSSGINNSDCLASNPDEIKWKIRLPQLLVEKWFGDLDTTKPLVWLYESNVPKDDPIVDWQIRWNYNDNEDSDTVPFTVFSTSSINSEGKNTVDTNRDSVFRESDINKWLSFSFWDNKTPFNRWTHLNQLTVVSQKANSISGNRFKYIFENNNFSNVQLRFSLLNILKGFSGDSNNPNVYPFLEYYVDFDGKEVPDRYYTITAEWNYADFQVNTIVRKPTTKETILWSFTSIF